MKSLYARIDEADRSDNAALSNAFLDWLQERLEQSDVHDAVQSVVAHQDTADAVLRAVATQVERP